jgi:uncharacterized membrane protein
MSVQRRPEEIMETTIRLEKLFNLSLLMVVFFATVAAGAGLLSNSESLRQTVISQRLASR